MTNTNCELNILPITKKIVGKYYFLMTYISLHSVLKQLENRVTIKISPSGDSDASTYGYSPNHTECLTSPPSLQSDLCISILTRSIPALLGSVYLNAQLRVFKSQGRLKHPLRNKTIIYFKGHLF
jgi:hypothetical protein